MKNAPKLKRTRRHVVVRLTPSECEAFRLLATARPIPDRLIRSAGIVRRLANEAKELAETENPKQPGPPTGDAVADGLEAQLKNRHV